MGGLADFGGTVRFVTVEGLHRRRNQRLTKAIH